jgi:hypothetical protein
LEDCSDPALPHACVVSPSSSPSQAATVMKFRKMMAMPWP